jgi:aspartokinase
VRAASAAGADPDLVVSSEVGVAIAVSGALDPRRVEEARGGEWQVAVEDDRALVCVVGSGLARRSRLRGEVLAALADWEPDLVALGASGTSAAAVLPRARFAAALRALHDRFFEGASR